MHLKNQLNAKESIIGRTYATYRYRVQEGFGHVMTKRVFDNALVHSHVVKSQGLDDQAAIKHDLVLVRLGRQGFFVRTQPSGGMLADRQAFEVSIKAHFHHESSVVLTDLGCSCVRC